VEERAGQIYAWWAGTETNGRIKAVAFGALGLCIAQPAVRTDHSPTYAINCYLVDPASIRRKAVEHRPAPSTGAPPPRAGTPPDSWVDRPPRTGLDDEGGGVLGNLPPLAQQLLQEPFMRGEEILRSDWHYEGDADRLSNFTFVIAGPRTVTVAAGTMVRPVGHVAATAHWSLRCYRADVVKRMGR
jgi:hypothetical protein